MQVEHDKKNGKLIITIDCNTDNPPKSASGKTLLVASETSKNSGVNVKNKPLTVAINAYVKADQRQTGVDPPFGPCCASTPATKAGRLLLGKLLAQQGPREDHHLDLAP